MGTALAQAKQPSFGPGSLPGRRCGRRVKDRSQLSQWWPAGTARGDQSQALQQAFQWRIKACIGLPLWQDGRVPSPGSKGPRTCSALLTLADMDIPRLGVASGRPGPALGPTITDSETRSTKLVDVPWHLIQISGCFERHAALNARGGLRGRGQSQAHHHLANLQAKKHSRWPCKEHRFLQADVKFDRDRISNKSL